MINLIKNTIFGRFFQIFFILATFYVMYLGGLRFLIISLIFFFGGGIFEFVIMNRFYSKPKENISIRDSLSKKIKNAFLWVHKNIDFMKKYNTTIYNFNKVGFLVSFFSYLIVFFYVLIVLFLFGQFSYYGFLIYLIPVLTNLCCFFRQKYLITCPFEILWKASR